jgi:hypothetical protein
MGENTKSRAEARMDAALAGSSFEDPRPVYRERLRYLREQQPDAFEAALVYYEETLVPLVASEDCEPLEAWAEYGQRLAKLTGPGKTVWIDASGRAHPLRDQVGPDQLTLHVPVDTGLPVLALAVPRQLSAAQGATLDLLVRSARAL